MADRKIVRLILRYDVRLVGSKEDQYATLPHHEFMFANYTQKSFTMSQKMRGKDQKQATAQLKKNYPVMEKFIDECEK